MDWRFTALEYEVADLYAESARRQCFVAILIARHAPEGQIDELTDLLVGARARFERAQRILDADNQAICALLNTQT